MEILLLCGMIAGPLFVIVFLIEGSLRENYDVLRQPVSALAIGKRGWIQQANCKGPLLLDSSSAIFSPFFC
jgi:hypothetical protein